MSPEQFEGLKGYVKCLAWFMGLSDWNVIVAPEPCEEGAYATIELTRGKRAGQINVQEGFFDLDCDVQREAITHELLHCHLHALTACGEDVEDLMGKPATHVWYANFCRQEEFAVDALARVIAPKMPYPAWKRNEDQDGTQAEAA